MQQTRPAEDGDTVLEGYDAEQVRLMDEVCIVLDEDDKPIGSASKKICRLLTDDELLSLFLPIFSSTRGRFF